MLGVFNLFPIPPLDGSRIVGAVMDEDTYRRWSALDQYGMLFLLLIFFVFNRQFSIIIREATNAVDADVPRRSSAASGAAARPRPARSSWPPWPPP